MLFTLSSCGDSKGPKGKVYVPNRTTDELVQDIIDAQDGDGWVYQYDVDLHKRIAGDWEYVGCHSIYMNLADDDDCNLWAEFDKASYKMPVYPTDDYGYSFKVQWQGDWYYF